MIYLLIMLSLLTASSTVVNAAEQHTMSTFESLMASPHLATGDLSFEDRDHLESFLNAFDAARHEFFVAADTIGSTHHKGIEVLQELIGAKGFQIICDLMPQFEDADSANSPCEEPTE